MPLRDLVGNVREKMKRALVGLEGGRGGPGAGLQHGRLEQLGDRPLAVPRCDVFESDREVLIVADVPGATKERTVVSWDERAGLTLLAPAGTDPDGRDWHRVFTLPEHADGAKATSRLKHGVLTVRVPKRAAAGKVIPLSGE